MSCGDGSCLVARAIPLPTDREKEKSQIESLTEQMNIISLGKQQPKRMPKAFPVEDDNKKHLQKLAEKPRKNRNIEAVSPADFLTIQSLRSSALARKMNTTSKLTRDCSNLFADLMMNELHSDSDGKTVSTKAKKGAKGVNEEKIITQSKVDLRLAGDSTTKTPEITIATKAEEIEVKDKDDVKENIEKSKPELNQSDKSSSQEITSENKDEKSEDLIARGPVRVSSRSSTVNVFHPYQQNNDSSSNNYGYAPHTLVYDPSSYNPNGFNFAYECGTQGTAIDIGWQSSFNNRDSTSSSNSSTPDSFDSPDLFEPTTPIFVNPSAGVEPVCEQESPPVNQQAELPDALSDFILKYSRRYTPSPEVYKNSSTTDDSDSTSIWSDSPYSVGETSLPENDIACNSPLSAISAPNSSPTAPRGCKSGGTPSKPNAALTETSEKKVVGLCKQGSSDSGLGSGGTLARPAKECLRALIPNDTMQEAWAWTCKCVQHHPGALTFQDSDRDTLLHICSQHMDLAKIYALVEQMIKMDVPSGGPPFFDLPNSLGQTALFLAVEKRCTEVVDYLLEAGASPNSQKTCDECDAPLHFAASRGIDRIVKTLCSYPSTKINSMNGAGLTPLLCAFKNQGVLDEETQTVVSNLQTIEILLKFGADPTIPDASNGKTIIHYCVEQMDPTLIYILRENMKADDLCLLVNKNDFCGTSPMQYLDEVGQFMDADLVSKFYSTLAACSTTTAGFSETVHQ